MNIIEEALKSTNPVYALRKQGCKVRVMHSRYTYKDELVPEFELVKMGQSAQPCGGATIIEVSLPNSSPDNIPFKAECLCNPKDNFNRKIAHRICLGRIAKQLT